jgi:phospholipid/cholesterol/gamma-HCH transport system substrate-binding protein
MSSNVKVGLAFFLGLLLLLFVTVAVTDVPIFQKGYVLYVKFGTVDRLDKDASVFFRGVKVGKVKAVTFDTLSEAMNQSIIVTCQIYDENVKIPKDSVFIVEESSLLGGMQLSILRLSKPSKEMLKDGDPVQGNDDPKFMSSLTNATKEINEIIKENRAPVKDTIANLERVSAQLTKSDNTLGAILNERRLYDDVAAVVERLSGVTEKLEQGTIGRLMSNPEIYDDLKTTVENLREASKQIRTEDSTFARIFYDDKIGNNLVSATENLQKFSERLSSGQGIAGMLFSQESNVLYDKILGTVENIEKATETLNDRRNSISRLLYDNGDLYENIFDFTKSLKSVGQKMDGREPDGAKTEKPGTIAMLLADQGNMYNKAVGALDNLNDAIGGIAKLETHMGVGYSYFDRMDYTNAKLSLKVVPRDTRYLLIAANFITPSSPSSPDTLSYNENTTDQGRGFVFMDVMLAQTFRWNETDTNRSNDATLTFRAGLLEGKFGAAVDFEFWNRWRVTAEARYQHKETTFHEEIDGYLGRAYLAMKLFDYFSVYGGVDNFGDHGAGMFGVSVEWVDRDVRSFVGLITLSN